MHVFHNRPQVHTPCLDLVNQSSCLCKFIVFHRLWPLLTSWDVKVKALKVCLQPSCSFGLIAFSLCIMISTRGGTRPLFLANNLPFLMLTIAFIKRSFLITQSLMFLLFFTVIPLLMIFNLAKICKS